MAGVRDQQSGTYYAGAAGSDSTNRIKYAAHGGVSAMKLGNNLWEHIDFNSRLQSTEIGLGTSSTDSSTLRLTYNYGSTNNNGNVQSVSYLGGGLSYTQSFGYDELNRLTTSSESGSSWSQTNKYDRYGNRAIDLGGGNQSLYFNTSNRITNSGYTYDAAGNLTNDGVQSFGYDAENKIKSVNSVSDVYRYDGDGNRIRKNFASGEQVRMVHSGGYLIAEYDLTSGALIKEYIYGATGLIATIEPSIGTQYTTADHLGSPRVITNASAGVVSRQLEIRIAHFVIRKSTVILNFREALTGSPELKNLLASYGVRPLNEGFCRLDFETFGGDFSLDVENVSVRSILDSVIQTSKTKYWFIKRAEENDEFFLINF